MAKEAAMGFYQLILEDEELRERTANLKPEEVAEIAKGMGFVFTADELAEAVKEDNRELTPEELEGATGGHDRGGYSGSKKEKTHCHGIAKGPRHQWVYVGHKEQNWGLFTLGINVYKCKLCGYERNVGTKGNGELKTDIFHED